MFEISSVVVVAVRGGVMLAVHLIARFSVDWAHSCQTKNGHGVHGLSRGSWMMSVKVVPARGRSMNENRGRTITLQGRLACESSGLCKASIEQTSITGP